MSCCECKCCGLIGESHFDHCCTVRGALDCWRCYDGCKCACICEKARNHRLKNHNCTCPAEPVRIHCEGCRCTTPMSPYAPAKGFKNGLLIVIDGKQLRFNSSTQSWHDTNISPEPERVSDKTLSSNIDMFNHSIKGGSDTAKLLQELQKYRKSECLFCGVTAGNKHSSDCIILTLMSKDCPEKEVDTQIKYLISKYESICGMDAALTVKRLEELQHRRATG